MNYFLDENFPKLAGESLRKMGHTVFDIRGSSDEGMSDVDIFNLAIDSQATFLTTDKDFFHTIHTQELFHPGIVVIALSQPNSSKIKKRLEWFLDKYDQSNLSNKCFLIEDKTCKVYSKS